MEEKTSIRDLLGDAPDEARRKEWLEQQGGTAAAPGPAEEGTTMDRYDDQPGDPANDQMTGQQAETSTRYTAGGPDVSGVSGTSDEASLSTADLASAAGAATAERTVEREPDRASWESASAPSPSATDDGQRTIRDDGGARARAATASTSTAPVPMATGSSPAPDARGTRAPSGAGSTAIGTAGATAGSTSPVAGSTRGGDAAPLFPNDEADNFRNRWLDLQAGFVDEPRDAVQKADGLVAEVIQRLAQSFADERSGLEHQWDRGEEVSTEDLRLALQRYRSFFDRLLSM